MPFAQAITDTPIPASVVPVKASFTGVEDPEAHLTTFHTQMMEIMRALQANVEASRIEQVKMHEDLVASQARNEELSKVTEELRQAL